MATEIHFCKISLEEEQRGFHLEGELRSNLEKRGCKERRKPIGLELRPERFQLPPPPPTFLSVKTSPEPEAPCPPHPVSLLPPLFLWGQVLLRTVSPQAQTNWPKTPNHRSQPVKQCLLWLQPNCTHRRHSPSSYRKSTLPVPFLSLTSRGSAGHGGSLSGPQFPFYAMAGFN